MGGSNSNLAEIDESSEGYHVLRVQENSPAKRSGMESFFDFILAIDQTRLNQDNDNLKELLQANVNKETKLTVYSSKTQSIRVVLVTPSNDWGGQGLLGKRTRYCCCVCVTQVFSFLQEPVFAFAHSRERTRTFGMSWRFIHLVPQKQLD